LEKAAADSEEKEGGRNAEARILGQDGDVVWLFLHDQPVAFAPADGTIVANRKEIEQRNLALQGLIPKELNFYAFDNGGYHHSRCATPQSAGGRLCG